MFYDSPLIGTGLGSYSQNLASEGYATWVINNTTHPHNDLLELSRARHHRSYNIYHSCQFHSLLVLSKQLLLLFVALAGSFVNMQFSSPYQMAFPLLLFGLYSGLIAKQVDHTVGPSKIITFPLKATKKIILGYRKHFNSNHFLFHILFLD